MSGSTFNYAGTIDGFFVSTTGLYDSGTQDRRGGPGGGGYGGAAGHGCAAAGGYAGGGCVDTGTVSDSIAGTGETAGAGDIQIFHEGAGCYLRGTRILTSRGTVRVEDLQPGDPVVTRFNDFRPVKWIGRQSFDSCFVITDRSLIPVRIHAGALGADLPARDLYVSPGHSVLIKTTLVPASSLVNGLTITQDWVPDVVEYFQIELAMHDCVNSEGAWSETFADGPGLRELFHNLAEFHHLYPHHQPPERTMLCAPRPVHGEDLATAIAPVVARAARGLAPGRLRGVFARTGTGAQLSGWAQDETYPELPVLLEVLADDQVIGSVLACEFREDLRAAGLAEGRCAFTFQAPARLRAEQIAGLRIRRAADGAELRLLETGADARAASAGLQIAA